MNDDNDTNEPKVIPLFKDRPVDTEFNAQDHGWENMVDLTLMDHQAYHEQTTLYLKHMAAHVEDLCRDIEEIQKSIKYVVYKLQGAMDVSEKE